MATRPDDVSSQNTIVIFVDVRTTNLTTVLAFRFNKPMLSDSGSRIYKGTQATGEKTQGQDNSAHRRCYPLRLPSSLLVIFLSLRSITLYLSSSFVLPIILFLSPSFHPVLFPVLTSPPPTRFPLSFLPSMSWPTHLYTHTYILTFHTPQHLQSALPAVALHNVLLVLPASVMSQSSQKWPVLWPAHLRQG
jgi:hypothetical protein